MSMLKRDLLPLVLGVSKLGVRRPPRRGEVVPIARWRDVEVGLGAVLCLRHRNDGMLASELLVAAKDRTAGWTSLDVDSGSAGYPDVFSGNLAASEEVVNIGSSEMWISEPDLNGGEGAPLRLFEVAVGESIEKITCSVDGRVVEQEISPLRIALIGVWSDQPATFHTYSRGGVRCELPVRVSFFE
ncbi:hypothetical protein ABZ260_22095 [Streptosporangium sp. NPDC006013]|uniref:hypothetical protein n=1 Tax=Streptosporangium sp. NPDC006013 TaxID=3155596 RepID=UPI0033B823B0